jgi:hypothetical protein
MSTPLLVSDEIEKTIEHLAGKIQKHFPASSLNKTCHSLFIISTEAKSTEKWIVKPNLFLRSLAILIIVVASIMVIYPCTKLHVSVRDLNIADLVQMISSGMDGLMLLGAGIFFLMTFETRRKRSRIISAINHLRCIAHIIDAQQLAKDPEGVGEKNKVAGYDFGRYLNYCSDMLSLITKVSFLYVQHFNDQVANEAVHDLETLTTALSQKIWQKIMMIRGLNAYL